MAQLNGDKLAWLPQGPSDAPPKRYRIGELARHTGLTRQTLHNYTRWGLIKEVEWTPGGHRLYDEAVFTRLSKILRLRKEHTVEEMKSLLDPSDANPARVTGKPSVEKGAIDQ
jgi:DNA-binding transcriptional MerR regulator